MAADRIIRWKDRLPMATGVNDQFGCFICDYFGDEIAVSWALITMTHLKTVN